MTATAEAAFRRALDRAGTAEAAFAALRDLAVARIGARLFTVMTVDMAAMQARRAYTSHPESYPTSGTKPVERSPWFAIVHDRQETFVANTPEEIAAMFPDAGVIAGLGCGAIVNLPVILGGSLAATVNLLAEAGYYTPARVARIEAELSGPAREAVAAARAM